MEKLLSETEAASVRSKEFKVDRHFAIREMQRIDFNKVLQIMAEGQIVREGRFKYRAMMPVKRRKIAFVLFRSYADYNELITVGITSCK